MPKAELHLHIEGTLEPELMFEIAKRNAISIPYRSVEEVKEAYKFSNLQDFLDIYYQGAQVLIHEQDFYDLTWSYLLKCKDQNIIHTEIMFDPQTHTKRGIPFETVIKGIKRACDDADTKLGISTLLIMSYLRHLPEEEHLILLKESLPYKHWIIAVGLDSSELGNPPENFKNVFSESAKEGYTLLAHAGEEGPPEYIYQALDILNIARIDHGNSVLDDEKLIERLRKEDKCLTVCPLSNVALRVVDSMSNHPLKKMMQKGLRVTVNSDDPAYFGGQLNENFKQLILQTEIEYKHLYELAKNSFKYSLLDNFEKERMLSLLDEFDTAYNLKYK